MCVYSVCHYLCCNHVDFQRPVPCWARGSGLCSSESIYTKGAICARCTSWLPTWKLVELATTTRDVVGEQQAYLPYSPVETYSVVGNPRHVRDGPSEVNPRAMQPMTWEEVQIENERMAHEREQRERARERH